MTKTELYADYGSYHADSRNRLCHAFGIPLIVLGVLGLLASVYLGPIDLAIPVALGALIYYATVSPRGATVSLVLFAVLYAIAVHLSWPVSLGAFVLGWVFQLVGHRIEGNRPKFLENLTYLAIGPLYFFEETYRAVTERFARAR
ncbi:MAG: DUF962 domain-containing protein [Candidatus Eremiobacteraeota bacterium]|nr:DUF962 domain-containing protein [Candidatus Eremiobacteraeota bacterium]